MDLDGEASRSVLFFSRALKNKKRSLGFSLQQSNKFVAKKSLRVIIFSFFLLIFFSSLLHFLLQFCYSKRYIRCYASLACLCQNDNLDFFSKS